MRFKLYLVTGGSLFVSFAGIVTGYGWIEDIPLLRTFLPGTRPTSPMTSLAFIFAGCVVRLLMAQKLSVAARALLVWASGVILMLMTCPTILSLLSGNAVWLHGEHARVRPSATAVFGLDLLASAGLLRAMGSHLQKPVGMLIWAATMPTVLVYGLRLHVPAQLVTPISTVLLLWLIGSILIFGEEIPTNGVGEDSPGENLASGAVGG